MIYTYKFTATRIAPVTNSKPSCAQTGYVSRILIRLVRGTSDVSLMCLTRGITYIRLMGYFLAFSGALNYLDAFRNYEDICLVIFRKFSKYIYKS